MVKARLVPLALALAACVAAVPVVSAMAAVQTSPGYSNAAVSGSAVVAEAERFLGYPYSYTGDSPATGFSCIGFVWYVYHELGMNIPGTNPSAVGAYPQVSESNLEPGDLVFFQGTFAGLYPSHVAIYIGGGKIIHAANPSYGVTISSLVNDPRDGDYWQEHYLSAERPWTGPASSGGGVIVRAHHILVVSYSAADLRSGPSVAYTVMTVLYQGDRVTVEGWAPGWVRIADASGTVGWLERSEVERDTGYQPTASIRRVRSSAWRDAKTVYVYALNVHTAPSIGAAVAFTLVEGNRVAVLSRSNGWAEIRTARGAAGRYGVNIRTVPSLTGGILATSNGSPVHVLRRSGGWAEVRLSTGVVGWVDGVFLGGRGTRVHRVSIHRGRGISGGRAVYPGVNIHSGPGVGYSIVGGTFTGMRIKVLGYSSGFAHVRTSTGISGWIDERFVEGSTASTVSRSTGVVRGAHATATIRLHSAAGLTASVIGLVYAGQRVRILGSSGGWDYVRLRTGATGYVYAAYISG